MYFYINWLLLIGHFTFKIPTVKTLGLKHNEKCNFQQTVNLTNYRSNTNGSYSYQGILIPIEKQKFYDYDLKFQGKNIPVPWHLRGCVCDKRPCIKLCCNHDEFYEDSQNKSMCELLDAEMKVSWNLRVQMESGRTKLVNIFKHFTTQVGLPCKEPEAFPAEGKWILKENGIIIIEAVKMKLNTLDYCYSPVWNNNTEEYVLIPFSCPIPNKPDWKILLNSYAMSLSVMFLIPTILVYLIFKELRSNLRGKLLICYLLSLTLAYSHLGCINISGIVFNSLQCKILGFLGYFFFMSAFLWLSALCYDILKNFKETKLEMNSNKNYTFIYYSLYVWLSSALATAVVIFIQFSSNVDSAFKPGIADGICWLNTKKWSAAIYFYGPTLIILLFNSATFVHLTLRIYKVRRDLAQVTHKDKFVMENALIVLRLFLIMGISWLFDILSYCLRNYKEWDFLFVLFDFANAIQGILIFSLFVMKRNVLDLFKKRFQRQKTLNDHNSRSGSNFTTIFTKLQSSTTGPIFKRI